jgi:hypothetical protein
VWDQFRSASLHADPDLPVCPRAVCPECKWEGTRLGAPVLRLRSVSPLSSLCSPLQADARTSRRAAVAPLRAQSVHLGRRQLARFRRLLFDRHAARQVITERCWESATTGGRYRGRRQYSNRSESLHKRGSRTVKAIHNRGRGDTRAPPSTQPPHQQQLGLPRHCIRPRSRT